ncbi:hypothetical protein A2U01_0028157, partial [Trifolium medium]|nr:hypothetical protein [Trifolium medium]
TPTLLLLVVDSWLWRVDFRAMVPSQPVSVATDLDSG